jgi:methyl coenzyme M reductase subunit C-like uncharacterized protein (methanogenesis marker protein 7)
MKTAASVLAEYPASAAALRKLVKGLQAVEQRRASFSKDDAVVPPLLIVNTTEECNLSCKGC